MISYKPFYQTLYQKGVTEYQLIFKQGVTANTLPRRSGSAAPRIPVCFRRFVKKV